MYRKLIGAWMSLHDERKKIVIHYIAIYIYIIAKCVADKIILLKSRCNKDNYRNHVMHK